MSSGGKTHLTLEKLDRNGPMEHTHYRLVNNILTPQDSFRHQIKNVSKDMFPDPSRPPSPPHHVEAKLGLIATPNSVTTSII